MKKFLILLFFACLIIQGKAQNNCLNFNGFSTDVSLPYDPKIDFTQNDAFTMEIWFKTSLSTVVLFSNVVDNYPFAGYELSVVGGHVVFDLCNYHPTNQLRTETVSFFNDGLWHHAAGVYYGSPSPNSVKLYVDGVLQPVNTTYNSLTGSIASGNEFHIGSRDNTTYFVMGDLDEPRLWNRPLCANEVVASMNCHLTGNEAGLVAYFNFNQGTAGGNNSSITMSPDLSPYGNNATLNGFNMWGTSANFITATNGVSGICPQSSIPFTVALTVTGNPVICKGSSANLQVSGGTNYTWTPGNQLATSIVVSPTVTTTYSATGVNAAGCKALGMRTVSVSNCVSLQEQDLEVISVFPNPGNGHVFLQGLKKGEKIRVYNALGALVESATCTDETKSINFTHQAAGLYFIEVRSAERTQTLKYLKQ